MMTSKASRTANSAFTLLEILLVMALVVVIFAIAIPALRGPVETARLRSTAELMRAEFAKARVEAMKSGRIQMFLCQQAGGKYRVIDWDTGEAGSNTSAATTNGLAYDASEDEETDELFDTQFEQLPEEIEFLALSLDEDVRGEQLLAGQAQSDSGSAAEDYFPPLLFYADGTSSSAQLVLKNTQNRAVTISLRGLTGTVRIGDVTSFAEGAQ